MDEEKYCECIAKAFHEGNCIYGINDPFRYTEENHLETYVDIIDSHTLLSEDEVEDLVEMKNTKLLNFNSLFFFIFYFISFKYYRQ